MAYSLMPKNWHMIQNMLLLYHEQNRRPNQRKDPALFPGGILGEGDCQNQPPWSCFPCGCDPRYCLSPLRRKKGVGAPGVSPGRAGVWKGPGGSETEPARRWREGPGSNWGRLKPPAARRRVCPNGWVKAPLPRCLQCGPAGTRFHAKRIV